MVIWLKKDRLGKIPAFLILMTSKLELCQQEYPLETGHILLLNLKNLYVPILVEYMVKVEPWDIGAILVHAWFWDRFSGSSLGETFKRSVLYWFHGCLAIQLESLWLYLSIRLRKTCLRRYLTKFSLVGTFKVQPSQLIDRQKLINSRIPGRQHAATGDHQSSR